MQIKCTSFLFAFSKLLRKRWWNCSLIASENHLFRSMFFSRLTLFWCSTLFTAVIDFSMTTLVEPIRKDGRCWPCWCQNCLSGLPRLEKKWNLGEMHTSLGQCPQLLFRHKGKKLDTLLFFFDVLAKITARLVGMSFFPNLRQVFLLGFSRTQCHEKICMCIPKLISPRKDCLRSFFEQCASFRCRHIQMDWKNCLTLSIVFFFWTTSRHFDAKYHWCSDLFFKCDRTF